MLIPGGSIRPLCFRDLTCLLSSPRHWLENSPVLVGKCVQYNSAVTCFLQSGQRGDTFSTFLLFHNLPFIVFFTILEGFNDILHDACKTLQNQRVADSEACRFSLISDLRPSAIAQSRKKDITRYCEISDGVFFLPFYFLHFQICLSKEVTALV